MIRLSDVELFPAHRPIMLSTSISSEDKTPNISRRIKCCYLWPETALLFFYLILTTTLSGKDLVSPPKRGQQGSEMLSNFPRSHSKEMTELGLAPFSVWSQAHVCLGPTCFPQRVSRSSHRLWARWAGGLAGRTGPTMTETQGDSRAVVGKHLLLSAISPGQRLSSRSQPYNLQSQWGSFQTSVPCTYGGHRNVDSKAQPGRKCTSLGTVIKETF